MKIRAFFAIAISAAVLGACTEREPVNTALVAPPLPATSRIGAPTAAPPIQHTTVSEKTNVSADGRSIQTTRTTTSVGFDPNKAAAAAERLIAVANRPEDGSLPGTWTSRSSSNGTGCTVALYGDPQAAQGSAASACNVSSVLTGVSSWRYADGRLSLYKGSEEALVLNRAGPHRFDGSAKWGFLSTTITLSR
jgi:hypothetical protein